MEKEYKCGELIHIRDGKLTCVLIGKRASVTDNVLLSNARIVVVACIFNQSKRCMVFIWQIKLKINLSFSRGLRPSECYALMTCVCPSFKCSEPSVAESYGIWKSRLTFNFRIWIDKNTLGWRDSCRVRSAILIFFKARLVQVYIVETGALVHGCGCGNGWAYFCCLVIFLNFVEIKLWNSLYLLDHDILEFWLQFWQDG